MADLILLTFAFALLAVAGYNIYWQAQIQFRANFGYGQVIWGGIFTIWMASIGYQSRAYIFCVAAFALLYIMGGVSGLGTTRLVSQGVFARFHKYKNLTGIALTPLNTPNGREMVVAIFSFNTRRVQLLFKQPLANVLGALKLLVPGEVPLTIEKIG